MLAAGGRKPNLSLHMEYSEIHFESRFFPVLGGYLLWWIRTDGLFSRYYKLNWNQV
jgi:hypothetical protein